MSKVQQVEHPIDALIESISAQCQAARACGEKLAAKEGPLTVEEAKVLESLSAVNTALVNMVARIAKLGYIETEPGDEEEEEDDEEGDEEEEEEEEED